MTRLLPLAAVLLSSGFVRSAPPTYRAGVAKVDVTPSHPIRLNGFGGRRTESEGTYHKIYARALAIDTGDGKPAVIVTVDALGIPADIYDALAVRLAKRIGLAKDRLAVAATHTHTGPMLSGANPTLFGVPIPKDHLANIDRYTPVFLDGLESASVAAVKDLRPAALSWGIGTVDFAANRRTPGGPTDHDLPVLFVKSERGEVRAVYTTYACHAVTLSFNKLGGDWPGYAVDAIEASFPGAVGLISVGCGADQNPSSGVTGDKIDVAREQGRTVAAEVKRLSGQFLAPVTGPLVAEVTRISLPLAKLPNRAEWTEKAKRNDAIGYHARFSLAKLDRGETLPTAIPYPVQTWTFGTSLAMVHLPGEVVVDYAIRLTAQLDRRRLWITSYANNAPCYIPSERVLKEGGYEGGGAMIYYDQPAAFKPGLEKMIVGAVTEHLDKNFPRVYDSAKTTTPALSPQQSLAAIQTKPGLTVDLVAAEPLVADPVAIAFGPDGKLWVAEMADYPLGKTGKFDPGGRVVVLESHSKDHRPDTSTVFLDNLPFPTGVLPWRKGVLICAAPDILYAEDTNGDGKADVIRKLYSGFGTDNYQARVNSLQYGLDGWVYGSCGLFGGEITCHLTGKKVALGDRDFRIRPDTGELEPATGRTQQGRVRDDAGNWFGCDNSDPVWHYVLDDQDLRRNPNVAATGLTVFVPRGPTPRRVVSLRVDAQRFALSGPANTFTAGCGLGIYRDDRLGAGFNGNAFTCEPVNLAVHRLELKPAGATFAGTRPADETDREFLASTDPWFRPVQAIPGPDGGLWIVDMYRYLIEHPRWIPPEELAKVDVRAGAGMGRLYRVRPADAPLRPWPRLDKLNVTDLVAALDSPGGWQRDMVMQLLLWKKDPAAKTALEKLAKDCPRDVTRLQALVTLDGLGLLRAETVLAALKDRSAVVRRHAVRCAELLKTTSPDVADAVLASATDPDVRVRIQVAVLLSGWAHPRAATALGRLIVANRSDPFVLAAAMSGLTRGTARAVIVATTKAATGPLPEALVRDMAATLVAVEPAESLGEIVRLFTALGPSGYTPNRLAAVAAVLDALDRRPGGWAAVGPTARSAMDPILDHARKVVDTAESAISQVLASIPLLGRNPTNRNADWQRLAGLLTVDRPPEVQFAALGALSHSADDAIPPLLIATWTGATPGLRSRLFDTLASRTGGLDRLLDALAQGTIPPGEIDTARRRRLLTDDRPAVRARAEKVFAATNPNRMTVIATYRSALIRPGDRIRGQAVFAKTCSPCHKLDGVGSAVGPDLAALADKSPRYLLGEILDPNRNVDSRFIEYRAVLKDGRTVAGVLAAETATGVTLRGQQGKDETVRRVDLDQLRSTGKSLMPEGLEADLPPAAMADLIAYLTATTSPPKKIPGNNPELITAGKGTLTLPAANAAIFGNSITFESEFHNIGFWQGANDHVAWSIRLDKAVTFDVYLDYACAQDSAGNSFILAGVKAPIEGKATSTGGWDKYQTRKIGTVSLPAGEGKITIRPNGPIRGALFDLRKVSFVPVGTIPK